MKKTIVWLLVLVLVLTSFSVVTFAAQPDRTYTYEEDNTPVPSTNAYQVKLVVDESITGTTRMNNPTDLFVDSEDNIYILDAGNNRVIILDKTYRCVKELKDFDFNGETVNLGPAAQGIFYREETKQLYIADTENDRVLVSDLDGKIIRIMKAPVDELLDPTVPYKPRKIVVDNMGIMYVTSSNINTGALLVDSANQFLGFFGTNKLKETAAIKLEHFWRNLFPNAVSSETFQPVEFNNLFWSDDRFVYTVSPLAESVATPISKLNALGNNVFPKEIDMYTLADERKIEFMVLADITVDSEGAVTILESSTGRLYQYDEGCNLLAIFGGMGYQKGLFQQPVALEADSQNGLLVLDAAKNSVTVMEQTFYGEQIRSANYLYTQGLYQESIEPWEEVLRMNANYTQAYVGLGKAYISMGEYKLAMDYFKLGNDPEGYAEAKALLRDETVRANFGLVAVVVIILLVVILFWEKVSDLFLDIVWKIRNSFKKRGAKQ